jgi:amidohydrolase
VVSVTWGNIRAGHAHNAIPREGKLMGTVRTTDLEAWEQAERVITDTINHVAAPFDVDVTVNYTRVVPPVVNDASEAKRMENTVLSLFGKDSLIHVERSLGGEDFSWYLQHRNSAGEKVVGAMARLGGHTPGLPKNDIHQPDLVIDERALDYSVPFLTRLLIQPADAPNSGEL